MAVTLAKALPAPLVVLNVCEALSELSAVSREEIDDIAASMAVRKALAHSHEQDAKANAFDYSIHQEIGRPAATILKYADEHDSDLIVLGSRGLDAVSAFLLGGVSNRVAYHAAQSVLIAR